MDTGDLGDIADGSLGRDTSLGSEVESILLSMDHSLAFACMCFIFVDEIISCNTCETADIETVWIACDGAVVATSDNSAIFDEYRSMSSLFASPSHTEEEGDRFEDTIHRGYSRVILETVCSHVLEECDDLVVHKEMMNGKF